MEHVATIIAATAGLVTAFAGLIVAVSKLGPVLKEFNKMLADQHKRAIDAKNKATSQAADSATRSADESRRFSKASIVGVVGGIACILLLATGEGPASYKAVAGCAMACILVIANIVTLLAGIILEVLLGALILQLKAISAMVLGRLDVPG